MPCIICDSNDEKLIFKYQSVNFYKCNNCGLIRTIPFPSKLEIINHYKNKFKKGNYNTILENMDMYSDLYRSYIKILKNKFKNLNNKRILDIGCFSGEFLDLAKAEGLSTYGIELQKDAYKIANKKHNGRILNCNFNKAKFKQKFDIITLFGLIEHLTDPDILMEKISNWLVPNGFVIIQTPNTGSIFSKILGKYWPPYSPVEHIHYFSNKNIIKFLNKYGYNNIKVQPHFKKLSIKYVYNMLENFGPEFYKLLMPVYKIMPDKIKELKLRFYIGEMIISGEKNKI